MVMVLSHGCCRNVFNWMSSFQDPHAGKMSSSWQAMMRTQMRYFCLRILMISSCSSSRCSSDILEGENAHTSECIIRIQISTLQRGHLSLGSKKSELHRGNLVRRHKICLREASVVVSTSRVFSRLFIAY